MNPNSRRILCIWVPLLLVGAVVMVVFTEAPSITLPLIGVALAITGVIGVMGELEQNLPLPQRSDTDS